MTVRWDKHFLNLALAHARLSKDPSTQVGAIIVGPDREIISAGFNGFPPGIADTPERLNDREAKLRLMVHAEENSLLFAGPRARGATMYMAATDIVGRCWGGAPCTHCSLLTIQAGISVLVTLPMKATPSRWLESVTAGRALLDEAGIKYREVESL